MLRRPSRPVPAIVLAAVLSMISLMTVRTQDLSQLPPPIVVPGITKLGLHSFVIPDHEVTLVPNVGVIVGSRATLIIDTGMGLRNARTVLGEVAKVNKNKTLFLTVTHSHAEHTSGMGAFPDGTTFVASKPVADELAATRGFAGMAKLAPAIGELLVDATLRAPDIVFDREHRLDLGGVHVRLMFLGPTHTAGDTLALVEEDGTLFAGDVVVVKRFPSFGPQSRYAAWLDVLSKVEALKPKVIVPSHGARGDVSAIDVQRRVMTEMHDRVAALKRDGRSLEEATKIVVAEFQAKYPDWRATIPNEIGPIVRSMYTE